MSEFDPGFDEDDEVVQASAVPYVGSDDDDEGQASITPCVDSDDEDDERHSLPPLVDGTAQNFITFMIILKQYGLDRKRPGSLINKYECLKCHMSLGEYICGNGHHSICFRCLKNMSEETLVLGCLDCRPIDKKNIYKKNESEEFKELKDMFTAFQPTCRGMDRAEFFRRYQPLDPSIFGRKYLKYKQKYLALKNMRRL